MTLYPCHRSAHTRHPRAHCAEFHRRRLTLRMKINHRPGSTISHALMLEKSESYKYAFNMDVGSSRIFFSLLSDSSVNDFQRYRDFHKCRRTNRFELQITEQNLPKSLRVILASRGLFSSLSFHTIFIFVVNEREFSSAKPKRMLLLVSLGT